MRLKVSRAGGETKKVKIEGEEIPVSQPVAVKVEKHKRYRYGSTAHLWLTNYATQAFGPIGIDQAEEAMVFGLRVGVIEQGGGGYYTLPGGDRVRGRELATTELRHRPEVIAMIRERAIASLADLAGPQVTAEEAVVDDPHGLSDVEV